MDAASEPTVALLARVKDGDADALDRLVERSLPPLRRWARGRLPQWARGLDDTQDLVQDAVLRALPRLSSFESRHPGALQAFFRQAVANRIIDEIRKVNRRPGMVELPEDEADEAPSPLDYAMAREGFERYEAALQQLKDSERQAIVARIELQQSYEEVAVALNKPTPDAARVAVTRAIARLVSVMRDIH